MNWLVQLRNSLGLDSQRDFWWLESTKITEDLEKPMLIDETTQLLGNCKTNLILAENVCLSIENKFAGIIIGRRNSRVRIRGKFTGILVCDELIITGESEVSGEIKTEKLYVIPGSIFKVKAGLGRLKNKMKNIRIAELNTLTVDEFKEKYG